LNVFATYEHFLLMAPVRSTYTCEHQTFRRWQAVARMHRTIKELLDKSESVIRCVRIYRTIIVTFDRAILPGWKQNDQRAGSLAGRWVTATGLSRRWGG
jgi:hypothetical protein